jgi:predicted chitinase
MSVQDDVKSVLRDEMDNRGWRNNDWRAGLAAIIGGESHFLPKFETGYAHTANSRIRMIFASRLGGMPDHELDELKSSDQRFFNYIYGPCFQNIHRLGNTAEDDGFKYRGGGLIQLTGRANYARYGAKVGADLIAHPELINVPRVAAAVAVEYMKDRFPGGDFDRMKRAVGVSIGEPDDEKNRLYAQYVKSGEWNYRPGGPKTVPTAGSDVGDAVVYDPIVTRFLDALHEVESFLKSRQLYSGPIDDDPGPGVRAGLAAYIKSARR